ncbi:MAG TPA: VOC family protein [Mariniphaga sp.]|nr:VOC family protein [Mariniphaga sp.]
MATVNTYLNFNGETEEAFNFYKSVFKGEFMGGIMRFSDVPPDENMPPLAEEDKNRVMHVTLQLPGGNLLMGSDIFSGTGDKFIKGNNVYINVSPDTREETDRIFNALKEGGEVEMEMQDMFWGDYFGSLKDKFGVFWMLSHSNQSAEERSN